VFFAKLWYVTDPIDLVKLMGCLHRKIFKSTLRNFKEVTNVVFLLFSEKYIAFVNSQNISTV